MPPIVKIIIVSGIVLILLGLLFWVLQPFLGWFGKLPGDIRVEKEGFRFYAPLASMLLLSILLSLILWIIRKF